MVRTSRASEARRPTRRVAVHRNTLLLGPKISWFLKPSSHFDGRGTGDDPVTEDPPCEHRGRLFEGCERCETVRRDEFIGADRCELNYSTFSALTSSLRRFVASLPSFVAGPGTGLIVLACFRVSNWVLGTGTRLVYVESWCRVRRLSLTGRLGARIVDRFGVCWSGVEVRQP